MRRVPRHLLPDGRTGAYRVYHQRYSPYTPLTSVGGNTPWACHYIKQYAYKIISGSHIPLQVSNTVIFHASSQIHSTRLQWVSEGLK